MALKRVLGAREAAWLVAGNMIGAGIFYTPGLVAEQLRGGVAPIAAWSLGGLLALAGAVVYGELGSRLPKAGGDYQYLRVAFGPIWGFLSGWAAFLLTFTAASAAMAIVAVDYLNRVFPALERTPLGWWWSGPPLFVLLLTWANSGGARFAGKTTAWLTGLPVAGLLGLFAAGLIFGRAEIAWPGRGEAGTSSWPAALGIAMIPIFFSYTGWNVAAYVAGEIRDPGRNLARALVWGTGLVALLYIALNLVLLLSVPQSELIGSTTAGADAALRLLGPRAERLLALAIAVAVLGTANVTLMAGSRIYYAMALDGLAPKIMLRVNRHEAPSGALWIAGVWTAVLAAVDDVDILVSWSTLAILLLSSMTVVSLFVFRRREEPAPFRCPGYPWVPLIYLLACLGVAVASFVESPTQSSIGLALVLAGLPVYAWLRR